MSVPEVDTTARRRRRSLGARRRAERRKKLALAAAGAAAAAGALLLAGYWSSRNYAPSGQVVAVVGHEEITLQDLHAEARARGVALSDAHLGELLAPVVDRTLLAHEAKAQELDRPPNFPADRRRIEQLLLAKQMSDLILGEPPLAPTLERLIALQRDEPFRFGQRQRLQLRQIRFEADEALMRRIGQTPTVTDLLTGLTRLGVPFQDEIVAVSTADLDPSLARTLVTLPADGLMLTRQGSATVADSVMSAEPTPLSGASALDEARRLISQRADHDRLDAAIAKLRKKAHIVYQNAGADR